MQAVFYWSIGLQFGMNFCCSYTTFHNKCLSGKWLEGIRPLILYQSATLTCPKVCCHNFLSLECSCQMYVWIAGLRKWVPLLFKHTIRNNKIKFVPTLPRKYSIHLVNLYRNLSLYQMTPLDVAGERGHRIIEEFLRGGGRSDVSAPCW